MVLTKSVFLNGMEEALTKNYPASSGWKTAVSLIFYILVYYALFRDLQSILLLVVVIIIHESGHFLAMKMFGYRDMKMFFIPFFGAFVSGKSNKASPLQRAIMILSGPLPGILIGSILFAISIFSDSKTLLQPALLFMVLNAINLLPVSPLDGGQFLQVIFPASNKIVQTIFTLLLIVVITWLVFRTGNYFLLILDIFLFYRLSILFGKKIQEPEPQEKNDFIPPDYSEIKPFAKSILMQLWLLGMLIPIAVMIYIAFNPDRFF
ncbi:MAG: site-2 protease family protein [Chitinophagaceae bacterium]